MFVLLNPTSIKDLFLVFFCYMLPLQPKGSPAPRLSEKNPRIPRTTAASDILLVQLSKVKLSKAWLVHWQQGKWGLPATLPFQS